MKKIIAIPVDTEEVLDAHFGHCKKFVLFEVESGKVINKSDLTPPPHEPGLLPRFLAEKGITDIIAGGMGNKAIQLFQQAGVNAFVGAPKNTAEKLVMGFINETIQYTANYCDH